MERRNRSLEALKRLKYIDSLESNDKADELISWVTEYLSSSRIEDFDLKLFEMEVLSELFYKNIIFMKKHRIQIKSELDSHHKLKAFLQ